MRTGRWEGREKGERERKLRRGKEIRKEKT